MRIDLEDALDLLMEAREADIDEAVANALFKVGMGFSQQKNWHEAYSHLDEAHYLCRKLENKKGQAKAAEKLAIAQEQRGKPEVAKKLLQEAADLHGELEDVAGRLSSLVALAEFQLRHGQTAEAVEDLDAALNLARQAKDPVTVLLLQQYRAAAHRELGNLNEALEAYREVGILSRELNDPQRAALALVGIGSLLYLAGQAEQGGKALDEAAGIYQGLGMNTRAGQVKAEKERLSRAVV